MNKEKVIVYIKNDLPTIFLYPHELGFLDYAFHNKILKLLKIPKFKNRKTSFKYKSIRYLSKGKGYLFFISLATLLLSLFFLYQPSTYLNNILFGLFLGISFAIIFQFIIRIFSVFLFDN